MSDSLALRPSPMPGESTSKPATKFSLSSMFFAALEALVAAQSHKSNEPGPLTYRYPPI